MNDPSMAIRIKDLGITFSSRRTGYVDALRGVSLELEKGATIALVGESGSGKTTLLRAILGLVRPNMGKIILLGKDMEAPSPQELVSLRRKCGYIPQDPYGCLPPTLNVLQAVTEPFFIVNGRKELHQGKEKAKILLKEVGLNDRTLWNSRVRTSLSGGQRQRVSIARALVLDPMILMADEPTSMQDASTRGEIIGILKRHVHRGMALVFVTHDLFLARASAERIMVLYKGLPCEEGPSGRIIDDPLHPYTRSLLAASPRLGKKISSGITGKTTDPPVPEGCPFQPLCPIATEECRKAPYLRQVKGRKVACWKIRE